MQRYRVIIAQQEFTVEIHETGIQVNGEELPEGSLSALNDQGLFLFQQNGRQQEMHIQRQPNQQIRVNIGGHSFTAEVERERPGSSHNKTRSLEAPDGQIRAPMPAIMIDLLVIEGDRVEAEQTLLILEAMKMQVKVVSPQPGIIRSIHRHPGDRVDKGELLIQLDPVSD